MHIEDLRKNKKETARHFVDFPGVIFFDDFYEHIKELYGAEITGFEADGTVEMWMEFNFQENKFYVDNKYGEYEFYVEDAECPETILFAIADHFRQLLESDETDVQEISENEM